MTVKLPTVDYKAAKDLLAADKNNVGYDDLSSLDNQTVSTAAVNLLKARQAADPSNSDQLQSEIDAINNGTMPAAQLQQILRSASNGELTDALFKTTYGISEAQFQQGQASGTLGSQYGLTPSEIAGMSSIMGSNSSELVKGLAKAGSSKDSMESKSDGPKATIAIGVGPLTSEMSLGEFISAIIAAVDSVLLSHAKTNMIDAAAAEMRINDVIKQAKDRITTMKAQAAMQISQLNDAINQIKAAKVLQTVMLVVAYIITVILVIASAIATACTFGAAAPTIAGSVLIGAAIIAATTVFFALQLKDIKSADGLNWMQRAANRKYGNDPNAQSAEDAAKVRRQKQQYETLLGSIQTIIDVVTAVASLGTSSVGTAVRVATEKSVQAIMRAIMDVIISMLKKLMAELQKVMKVIGLVLMVGSGTINAMLTSGQLEDLMARDSSIMKSYRSKFTSQAVEARYKEMRANPQYASLSDDQLMSYASTEQSLINSGDKTALAELYARRENFEQGKSGTIDLTDLHNGSALGDLNTYKQSQLMNRASGDIHQRTLDSVNSYQSAMDEFNQKNQGLIMAITIGAALAGMAGGIGLASGGKSLQGAENEVMQSAAQSAKNLTRRASQEMADAGEEAAEAIKRAARRASQEIADTGQEAAQASATAARKAGQEIADIGDQATDMFKKGASKADEAAELAASASARARQMAQEAGDEVAQSATGATRSASRKMVDIGDQATDMFKKGTGKADEGAGLAASASTRTRQIAQEAGDEVAQSATGATRSAGREVADIGEGGSGIFKKAAGKFDEQGHITGGVSAKARQISEGAGMAQNATGVVRRAGQEIADTWSQANSMFKRAASRAGEAAETAAKASSKARQMAKETGNRVAETTLRSVRKAGREIADHWNRVSQMFKRAAAEAGDAAETAARASSKARQMTKGAGSEMAATASASTRRAGHEIADLGEQASRMFKGAASRADDAAQAAESASIRASQIAQEAGEQVAQTSSGATRRAGQEIADESSSNRGFGEKLTLTAEDAVADASMSSSGAMLRAESRVMSNEAANASDTAADAAGKAALRAKRFQDIFQWVQASSNIVQGAASSASEIYQQELNIKTIKNELAINEKRRQFELIFVLQDLATEVLNQLKEDIMEIETRSLSSAKQFNAAIASIWKGLEASFKAAEAKKN